MSNYVAEDTMTGITAIALQFEDGSRAMLREDDEWQYGISRVKKNMSVEELQELLIEDITGMVRAYCMYGSAEDVGEEAFRALLEDMGREADYAWSK